MTSPAYRIICAPSNPPPRIVAAANPTVEGFQRLIAETGATAFVVQPDGTRTPIGGAPPRPPQASAQPYRPSTAVAPPLASVRAEALRYDRMAPSERDALWRSNPTQGRALLEARSALRRGLLEPGETTHNGLTYDQMTPMQRAELALSDRAKFDRMRHQR